MPTRIDRDRLRELLDSGAQLVEVLPRQEYAEAHLPGAVNLPLEELTRESAAMLARDRAVITYCSDTQCDVSPRAAWRLESLGFTDVYHYAPGKADWLGAGLPFEGTAERLSLIDELARRDVPTCSLDTKASDVRRLLDESGWDSCFVVNEQRIVLGRVYHSSLKGADDNSSAEELMDPGPSTYRPDITAMEMAERMRQADLQTAPVTRSSGELIGIVLREDVERAASETPESSVIRENPAAAD